VAGRLTGPVGYLTHPAYLLPILYLALGPGIVSTELFYRVAIGPIACLPLPREGTCGLAGMCGVRFFLRSRLPPQIQASKCFPDKV
jgi:hypothetical protein